MMILQQEKEWEDLVALETKNNLKPIVYTHGSCSTCERVMQYLDDIGIDFEERAIDIYPEFRKELNDLGYTGYPLTIIGRNQITGYKTDRIDRALRPKAR